MCTVEKRGNLFILTLTGDDEHRLSPSLIDSILAALSQIRAQASPGSVLITTSHGKFFSNGFDLRWAHAAGSVSAAADRLSHMVHIFKPVVAQLLSLPMPSIAAISGHAAAAGFILALSHDYLIMRSDRGVLYMSEVDLGLTLPDYFTALFNSKIGSGSVRRDVFLRGMKVKGEAAVRMGIVESAHDGDDGAMKAALRLGEQLAARNWEGEPYAEIRKSLYPGISRLLGLPEKLRRSIEIEG
ncbi:enoyl-CoA delta isomerase 2, peroxisomal-like [Momordica charantia]|uniref:Delta(3)-Delta(2)-enoyl-CoA isomerase n=1 Tax=Momordica charantia TaxID=3673 RepID=A0A6J1CWQ4_MOMCH|nr:enoyl-CoA delta isomerase 2, peroxisomal-like [Momordica charantia]